MRREIFEQRVRAVAELLFVGCGSQCVPQRPVAPRDQGDGRTANRRGAGGSGRLQPCPQRPAGKTRSEEHTSELQSLRHLVCRLLLEKKKKKKKHNTKRKKKNKKTSTNLTTNYKILKIRRAQQQLKTSHKHNYKLNNPPINKTRTLY